MSPDLYAAPALDLGCDISSPAGLSMNNLRQILVTMADLHACHDTAPSSPTAPLPSLLKDFPTLSQAATVPFRRSQGRRRISPSIFITYGHDVPKPVTTADEAVDSTKLVKFERPSATSTPNDDCALVVLAEITTLAASPKITSGPSAVQEPRKCSTEEAFHTANVGQPVQEPDGGPIQPRQAPLGAAHATTNTLPTHIVVVDPIRRLQIADCANTALHSSKKSFNVESPSFTPAQLPSSKKGFSTTATPFTPRGSASMFHDVQLAFSATANAASSHNSLSATGGASNLQEWAHLCRIHTRELRPEHCSMSPVTEILSNRLT